MTNTAGGDDSASADWHVVAVVENVPFGQDHRLRKQIGTLLETGARVSVITPRDPANAPHRVRPGLRLLEYRPPPALPGPAGYLVEYGWSLACAAVLFARLRRRERVDVVQVCQPPDIYFALAPVLRRTGSRVVVDQRDLMPELLTARYPGAPRGMQAVLRLLERWTQRAVDRTVTVNEVLRGRLVAAGGRPENVSVVWNGPVLARVDAARPDPALREPGRPLVVWVGKMGVQDGVDLLPEVVDAVVRGLGRTDLRFAFLGDGECLGRLRERVAQLGLTPWVTLPGWVPEETVFCYLASADAGVDICQQVEVTPVKALEYMAFGLPFVCFDIAETRRLAADAAVLVEAGDVTGLAEALVALLDAPGRAALGEAGRRAVTETLAWERQVPEYLAAVGPEPHGVR